MPDWLFEFSVLHVCQTGSSMKTADPFSYQLGAMRSTLCLRLARQSANSRHYAATRCVVSSMRVGGLPSFKTGPGNALLTSGRRSLSSGTELRESRFAPQHKVREPLSPFKQHRREMFQEDQESQDPLYPDLFPRLEDCQTRESISEFLEQFETASRSEQEVTLYGRVRAKRVIGKGLVFLDIVNEFQKVQVMINKNACTLDGPQRLRKFGLFRKMLQIGDHICRLPLAGLLFHLSIQYLLVTSDFRDLADKGLLQRSWAVPCVRRPESQPSKPARCRN